MNKWSRCCQDLSRSTEFPFSLVKLSSLKHISYFSPLFQYENVDEKKSLRILTLAGICVTCRTKDTLSPPGGHHSTSADNDIGFRVCNGVTKPHVYFFFTEGEYLRNRRCEELWISYVTRPEASCSWWIIHGPQRWSQPCTGRSSGWNLLRHFGSVSCLPRTHCNSTFF